MDSPHIGSLTGGGRYDTLIGTFSKHDIPAVGTTIGLDRIYTAMQQLQMPLTGKTTTDILITVFDAATQAENLKLAAELRQAGLRVEVYLDKAKIGRQFEYADRKGIPLVAIQGGDEITQGIVQIKDMKTSSQKAVNRTHISDIIKSILKDSRQNNTKS
jgi:histidyl-tRNA synthetase